MKWAACLAGAVLWAGQAQAAALDLSGYQEPDGAISVAYRGDLVDPYFAIRALLTARNAGLDTDAAARAWIGWLLPRQLDNGSFARYCRRANQAWKACLDADADDALLAIWTELLYTTAPRAGLPASWSRRAALAQRHLERLRDRDRAIYLISANNRVGLLMDNVEIHAALSAIGQRQQQMGALAAARRTLAAATQLRRAIGRVFRPAGQGPFRVSTQAAEAPRFYPEIVAQIYPVLYQFPDSAPPRQAFQNWMRAHGAVWLEQQGDTYPWGLVAMAARAVGDTASAACWKSKAAHLRYGARWNVLEEAAFQSIVPAGPETGALCVPTPAAGTASEGSLP